MPSLPLTQRQISLLFALADALEHGLGTLAIVMRSSDGITIVFTEGKDITPEGWNNITESDLAKFTELSFFTPIKWNQYGPFNYALDEYRIVEAVQRLKSPLQIDNENEEEKLSEDARTVFVVHGRNLSARNELFTFLRAINLKPLEWSQAVAQTGKGSPYIGEILESAFSQARAIIVLMTPEDEVRLHPLFQKPKEEEHERLFMLYQLRLLTP